MITAAFLVMFSGAVGAVALVIAALPRVGALMQRP